MVSKGWPTREGGLVWVGVGVGVLGEARTGEFGDAREDAGDEAFVVLGWGGGGERDRDRCRRGGEEGCVGGHCGRWRGEAGVGRGGKLCLPGGEGYGVVVMVSCGERVFSLEETRVG